MGLGREMVKGVDLVAKFSYQRQRLVALGSYGEVWESHGEVREDDFERRETGGARLG